MIKPIYRKKLIEWLDDYTECYGEYGDDSWKMKKYLELCIERGELDYEYEVIDRKKLIKFLSSRYEVNCQELEVAINSGKFDVGKE